MNTIKNQTFDQERALYGSSDLTVDNCNFDGPADGESALKESKNIIVSNSYFNLRYPFWHDENICISNCIMTSACRAALWYSSEINIKDSKMHGIKALRECKNAKITDCDIISPEFGWSVNGLSLLNDAIESEYFLMRSENIICKNINMRGKYSFQYIKNAQLQDCELATKDAFWHAENVEINNSVIKGEYLAWYSNNLTFINCKISGTQPFCYCKNLRLIDCEMTDADLCFEKSEVNATLTAPLLSIKNPRSGIIRVPHCNEIIFDDPLAKGEIISE